MGKQKKTGTARRRRAAQPGKFGTGPSYQLNDRRVEEVPYSHRRSADSLRPGVEREVIRDIHHVAHIDGIAKLQDPTLGPLEVSDFNLQPRPYLTELVKSSTVISVPAGYVARVSAFPLFATSAKALSGFTVLHYSTALLNSDLSGTQPTHVAPLRFPWSGLSFTDSTGVGGVTAPHIALNGKLSISVAPGGYDVPPRIDVYETYLDNDYSQASGPPVSKRHDEAYPYFYMYTRDDSDINLLYKTAYAGAGTPFMSKQGNHAFCGLMPSINRMGAMYISDGGQVYGSQTWTNLTAPSGYSVPIIEVVNNGNSTMSVHASVDWWFAVPLTDMMANKMSHKTGTQARYNVPQLHAGILRGIGTDESTAKKHAGMTALQTSHPMLTNAAAAGAANFLAPHESGDHHTGILSNLFKTGSSALKKVGGNSGTTHHGFFGNLFDKAKALIPKAASLVKEYAPEVDGVIDMAADLGIPGAGIVAGVADVATDFIEGNGDGI